MYDNMTTNDEYKAGMITGGGKVNEQGKPHDLVTTVH